MSKIIWTDTDGPEPKLQKQDFQMTSESTFKLKKNRTITSARKVESCNWPGNYYIETEPDRRTSKDDSHVEGEDVPDRGWNENERLKQEEDKTYDGAYTDEDEAVQMQQAMERSLTESTSSELDRFKKDLVMRPAREILDRQQFYGKSFNHYINPTKQGMAVLLTEQLQPIGPHDDLYIQLQREALFDKEAKAVLKRVDEHDATTGRSLRASTSAQTHWFRSSLRAALTDLGREKDIESYVEHLQELSRKYDQSLATE